MRINAIKAIIKRELASYFSSPTGYVFICIFIFLSAFAAFWLPGFFNRNLANLDQLNMWFPALLVLLAPAIAMGSWAEERKQGTDELLLTLPARDVDLVIGKYLACLAIYTVALVFSLSHVLVLSYLGNPDIGVLASTYFGHWFAGAALIAVAMIGSALTANLTVAFIASALLCGLVVGIGEIGRIFPNAFVTEFAKPVSFSRHFAEFGRGIVAIDNIAYFLVIAVIGLWVNVFLVGRRHWVGARIAPTRTTLWFVRLACLLVIGKSAVVLLTRAPVRADTTAEQLWSLSPQTRTIVSEIDPTKPVLITAYVSKEVPSSYVQTHQTLLGLLDELSNSSGRVAVRVEETEKFSDAAREAKQNYNIGSRTVVPGQDEPDQTPRDVFMGLAFTCGTEQFVIPFLSKGLPVEYELARSIRTVSMTHRRKVGVLDTEAGLFGQFDFQTGSPGRDWPVIDELRKQHEVIRVTRGQPIPSNIDVLIVAQPSTLRGTEFSHVMDYVQAGRPAIVLEDPMPIVYPPLATLEPRESNDPFGGAPRDREPKTDLRPLYEYLGVEMPATRVVWDSYNPRPQLATVEREFVFVGKQNKAAEPFNTKDPITSGLQEVLMPCVGEVKRSTSAASTLVFTPLITSSPVSGYVEYRELLQRGAYGPTGFNPQRRQIRSGTGMTLAAHVTGTPAALPAPLSSTDGPPPAPVTPKPVNVVLIPDIDVISDAIFEMRAEGMMDLELDNVTLILNAVDSLAGDESLLSLRNRRREHRTLVRLDESRAHEQEQALQAADAARTRAEDELAKARTRLEEKVKEIEERKDLDDTTRRIMMQSVRSTEQRRLDVQAATIEDARQTQVNDSRAEAIRDIEKIQTRIRLAAVLLPPIPALLLAGGVFAARRRAENLGVSKGRLR